MRISCNLVLAALFAPCVVGFRVARAEDMAPIDPGFAQLVGPNSASHASAAEVPATVPGSRAYHFADGSRLVVRPVAGVDAGATVVALAGQGKVGLPRGLAAASWALAFVPLGGTPWGTYDQLEHWLNSSGHTVKIVIAPDVSEFRSTGSSSSNDIGYQIAIQCSLMRHPVISDGIVAKVRAFGSTLGAQIRSDPGLMFDQVVQNAVSGLGSNYSELPTVSDMPVLTGEKIDEVVKGAFGGPIDMAVVGNVSPDAVASIFASRCTGSDGSSRARVSGAVISHFMPGQHTASAPAVPGEPARSLRGMFWDTAVYGRCDRHRIALETLATVLKVRLSAGISTHAKRIVPAVVSQLGIEADRFGYFGVAIDEISTSAGRELSNTVRKELVVLSKDPDLEGQVAAVLKLREKTSEAAMQDQSRVALALAQSLADPERWSRFSDQSVGNVRDVSQDVRSAATWLAGQHGNAMVSVERAGDR